MPRCSTRSGLKIGDPLLLGDTSLRVGRVITLEPDRGAGFMSFSPRVMLNQADVARTALVQPASRVGYRYRGGRRRRGGQALHRLGRGQPSRRASCAACGSTPSKAAGPRCARRSTAPRNS
jgi:predicted lysophospholipase L1 biosynthesis ABC-type transport system permease subunit